MAMLIYTEIHDPVSQKYADLSGIRYDLEDARKFALRLASHGKQNPLAPDADICEALTIACLIKYWRCFSEGTRKSLLKIESDIIASLPMELRENHELFGQWRSKNIAHSVDETEQNQPHARYYKENPEKGVLGIGCTSTSLKAMSTSDAEDLIILVDAILEKLNPVIEKEAEILCSWARSQPINKLIEDGNPFRKKSYRIGRPRKQNSQN